MKQIEHQLQVAMCRYLDYMNIHFFAVPNGGMRNVGVAKKLKAEGVKAGVADLFLMIPNQIYAGLFIEVKTATGRQTETQKLFQQIALDCGYAYEVVRTLDDLIEVVNYHSKLK